MWDMHEGMGWWMVFGGIMTVLFFAGIIALVVWSISKLGESRSSGSSSTERRDPLSIAKERYARGDITKEEFERIKKDLS
jgi:putative membrane protein